MFVDYQKILSNMDDEIIRSHKCSPRIEVRWCIVFECVKSMKIISRVTFWFSTHWRDAAKLCETMLYTTRVSSCLLSLKSIIKGVTIDYWALNLQLFCSNTQSKNYFYAQISIVNSEVLNRHSCLKTVRNASFLQVNWFKNTSKANPHLHRQSWRRFEPRWFILTTAIELCMASPSCYETR